MHHQPWRLIDDDEGVIFVNNIEGDCFGDVSSFIGRWDGIDLNLLSSPDSVFGGRVSIFDRYLLTRVSTLAICFGTGVAAIGPAPGQAASPRNPVGW